MNTLRFSLLLCGSLALFGCKPTTSDPLPEPVPEADTGPAAAQAGPGIDATAVVENTPAGDASTMDAKQLAGKFGDGESVLELRDDGSYLQTLQAGSSSITADGSWSSPAAGSLLLDPNSKSAEDARFEVVTTDELRAADGSRTFRRIAGP